MPRPTPAELEHDQRRHACLLFYRNLPKVDQAVVELMMKDYDMSIVQLVSTVWADKVAEYIRELREQR